MKACKVCGAEVKAGGAKGMCARCYQRDRRGLPPAPKMGRAAPGEGDRLSFRLTREQKVAVTELAEREGATVADWCREAVAERIARLKRQSKRR